MPQSNIFEAGAVEVTELFADYLEGDVAPGACIALAVSGSQAGALSRNALEKSLAALDYGEHACTYLTLLPSDAQAEGGDIPLDTQSLFLLVEGLDPFCIIATDQQGITLLAESYRTAVAPDSATRLFGRPVAAFDDLEALLATNDGKQKAWALLKTLR